MTNDAIWYTPAETTGNLFHDSIPIQCPRSLRYADACSLRCYSGGLVDSDESRSRLSLLIPLKLQVYHDLGLMLTRQQVNTPTVR